MATVNACFEPDDGVVSTNGVTPQQQQPPVSNTTNAETKQQNSAIFWPGNDTFHVSQRNIGHFCSELRQCLTMSVENISAVYSNYLTFNELKLCLRTMDTIYQCFSTGGPRTLYRHWSTNSS